MRRSHTGLTIRVAFCVPPRLAATRSRSCLLTTARIAALAVDDVVIYFGQNCPAPELRGTSFLVEAKVSWLHKATGARHELAQQQSSRMRRIPWCWRERSTRNLEIVGDHFTPDFSTLHGAPRDASLSFDSLMIESRQSVRPFAIGPRRHLLARRLKPHGQALSVDRRPWGRACARARGRIAVGAGGDCVLGPTSFLPIGAVERRLWQVHSPVVHQRSRRRLGERAHRPGRR